MCNIVEGQVETAQVLQVAMARTGERVIEHVVNKRFTDPNQIYDSDDRGSTSSATEAPSTSPSSPSRFTTIGEEGEPG